MCLLRIWKKSLMLACFLPAALQAQEAAAPLEGQAPQAPAAAIEGAPARQEPQKAATEAAAPAVQPAEAEKEDAKPKTLQEKRAELEAAYIKERDSQLIAQGFPSEILEKYPLSADDNLFDHTRILALQRAYASLKPAIGEKDGQLFLKFPDLPPLFWADGKMLPESEASKSDQYRPYIQYTWRQPSLPWEDLPDGEADGEDVSGTLEWRYRRQREWPKSGPAFQGDFFKAIYGGDEQADVEKRIIEVEFVGWPVKINSVMESALMRVQQRIMDLSKQDEATKKFLDNLSNVVGYGWRNIRGSNTPSYHAFGAAVDMLPVGDQEHIYWIWDMAHKIDWHSVTDKERWMPPLPVINIFEEEGFYWGGRWENYDTMHFEYRPELTELYTLDQIFDPLYTDFRKAWYALF